ncbi:65-kDa microtubule-associated protein 5 isoform X1 [Nicotiana sylvestris]|uniref:65-kDa microtubule-associated protein 5 isoform X1 n=1 Tax=Nicotiana sylvestris TaxID=4096 RepID=A0A1U7WQ37_NICSY|nr:PREDICTED: 65-kDa microtubule-associated protein 5 isoform X1 [Nicotiana sylvestris]
MSSMSGSSPLSLSKSGTTTCATLLQQLQEIWDEIGESDSERDKKLLQVEQECLDIYRRNVEKERKYRAELHQSLAEAEAEISKLVSALGEQASLPLSGKIKGTLKQKLSVVDPVLKDIRTKKQERIKEFLNIETQIAVICAEIAGNDRVIGPTDIQVDEQDLTAKRLGELKSHLQELQSEKKLRLQRVNSYMSEIHELSVVMSLDFKQIIANINPSLVNHMTVQSKSISNETLASLTSEVNSLKQLKQQRLERLQDLGSSLIELWNLMDMPMEEQLRFNHITSLVSSSIDEVSKQGSLAIHIVEQAEVEVERLNVLKTGKLKELIFKRQNELEEIYRSVHMDVDIETARQILIQLMESGSDLSYLLSSMDDQVVKAKEQAASRKEVLDKVEKWKHASQEESWLDEYEKDENRYSAGKGVHINLKRAEKARILVSKIPSLIENLTAKVKAWEKEKGMPFLYHKAPLLHTLEEYIISRQEKQEEKRRSREQKRLQDQFAAEQETIYGSKSAKKPLGNANTILGTPNSRRVSTPSGRYGVSIGKEKRGSGNVGAVIPVNYVALAKDDQKSGGL